MSPWPAGPGPVLPKLGTAINNGQSVLVAELFGGSGTIREVTPDARRRPVTTAEFVAPLRGGVVVPITLHWSRYQFSMPGMPSG
ncbi:hypothetical protein I6J71_01860 [Amycolatopsis sp. FDAARGOS 1241]|nr:hypothetical protein I6J71_01860 [Amycolatopsis sp. FDAARGOS 1241]